MFTGIIEEIGIINCIEKKERSEKLKVECKNLLKDVKIGDSISTNGVCLTVASIEGNIFTSDIMHESIISTNLDSIYEGDKVNLERAIKVGDRLGGHIVSGHVDGVGEIVSIRKKSNSHCIEIKTSKEILKYIITKGSITIDGTSLTVSKLNINSFEVSIVPTTALNTIILSKSEGDLVNLENDIIGKYIEQFMSYANKETKNNIDINFLKENGFY